MRFLERIGGANVQPASMKTLHVGLLGCLVFPFLSTVARADAQAICPAGAPPMKEAPSPGLRLRSHVDARDHHWIGPAVPAFVPAAVGTLKLDLLDRAGALWVALYREDLDACGAATPGARNCDAEVRLFDCAGHETAAVRLSPLMSRRDQLEVQDVRYDGGALYFNEACQTYSREAGGRCSSLVAVDPIARRVLWRTPPLTSNNWFVVAGDYLVSAYGFTGERATIRLVRRSDGAIVDAKPLERTNFEMFLEGDTVAVDLWNDVGRVHFKLVGLDGKRPKLVRMRA